MVLVFARWWADGPVKTRLAATLGAEPARRVYRALAEQVWRGLEADGLDRMLCVAPATAVEPTAAWLGGSTRVVAQTDGDLGARMSAAFDAAFKTAFAAGPPWAAVVGTDAPAIDARRVLEAGDALAHADVAIVPSLDGGYALLALRRPAAGLFTDVPWSTDRVLAVTLDRCAALGLRASVGEPVRDLDDEADLDALRDRLVPGDEPWAF